MEEESLLILGVVSIISAFIAMGIFEHKGRSAASGFALGFFLGWIGVIIALFASPEQAKLEQRKFDSGGIGKCPYCKEFINLDATTCKHCHQPLLPDAIIRQHRNTRRGKCINCQASLKESAKFCPYCGTSRAV